MFNHKVHRTRDCKRPLRPNDRSATIVITVAGPKEVRKVLFWTVFLNWAI